MTGDGPEHGVCGSVEDAASEASGIPSAQARRLAKALTWTGVGLFWVAVVAMSRGGGVALVDAILLAVLLVVVPAFALAQVPLIAGATIERVPAYWSSILTLWVLGAACWLVGSRDDGGAALGLVGLPVVPLVLWSVGLTLAGLSVIALFRSLAAALRVTDSPLLEQLLPRTAKERRLFGVLSVAAGVGEELAYRGYVIPVLAPLAGVVGGAVISTVVFGIIHAYQGPFGVVRTGLMGGILAWGFLASGSLWPPIIAHTVIDIVAGIVVGERLLLTQER